LESKWRWNVADLGFAGSQWKTIARLLTPYEGYDYILNINVGGNSQVIGTPLVFPDDKWAMQFTIVTLPGEFPWGLDIEPGWTGGN